MRANGVAGSAAGVVVAVEMARPRLRGLVHEYAFFASLVTGAALVVRARSPSAAVACLPYAWSLSACLGVSALYHRRRWGPSSQLRMSRLDRSMIFLFIGCTYTTIALLAFSGGVRTFMLLLVWTGVVVGISLVVCCSERPRRLELGTYVALGWSALAALPALIAALGLAATLLLAGGGLLFTAGAVVYALGRPNPVPEWFGFHEVFHSLVVAGAAVHFLTLWLFILPQA